MKSSSVLALIALAAQATFALPAEKETLNNADVVLAKGEIDAAAVCYDGACRQGGNSFCWEVCRAICRCGSGRCGGLLGFTCICSSVS